MNKAFLSLLIIISLASVVYNVCEENRSDNQISSSSSVPKKRVSLSNKYLNSILAGGIVGSAVGIGNAIWDNHFSFPFLLSWLIAGCIRESMVNVITKDMQTVRIAHNGEIVHMSAWAASWLTYIYYYKYIR